MSASLKAYYLQQMGIDVWVRRPCLMPDSNHAIILAKQAEPTLFIVLDGEALDKERQWLSGAEGDLLTNMLRSIGLLPESVALICGDQINMANVIEYHVSRYQPRAILALTYPDHQAHINAPSWFSRLSPGLRLPLVCSFHPQALLQTPAYKKLAYRHLLHLKTALSSETVAPS